MRKVALGIAAAVSFSGAANALPIINGSFANGPAGSPFTTVPAGSTAITGWDVESGSVDYIKDYWQHQDGSPSIDLAGNANGTLSQTFATNLSQLYRVIFYVARNPDGGIDPRTGFAGINGVQSLITFNNSSTTRTAMGWQKRTFTFTGTGSDKLSFSANPATSNNAFGLALDNVSVSAVPEPSTWAMLILGFGFVGGAMRRRRSNVRVAFA